VPASACARAGDRGHAAARHGFKRVLLDGWRTRSLFLLVPVALALLALHDVRPWMAGAFVASIFGFCFFRAVGMSAQTPWLYAVLPPGARGRYFASDQALGGAAGIITMLGCAGLFAWLPIFPALFVQYAVALAGAWLSYRAMGRLADAPRPTDSGVAETLREVPRLLFTPSPFRRYLALCVGGVLLASPFVPFAAYHLRTGPQFSAELIMFCELVRYLGLVFAAWAIQRRIDSTGARPVLFLALGAYAMAAVLWWLFLWNGFAGTGGVLVAYFLLGVGLVGWTVANLHYLPTALPAGSGPIAVSLHNAVASTVGGLAPVVWGFFLRRGPGAGAGVDPAAFAWYFVSVIAGAAALAWGIARLPREKRTP